MSLPPCGREARDGLSGVRKMPAPCALGVMEPVLRCGDWNMSFAPAELCALGMGGGLGGVALSRTAC